MKFHNKPIAIGVHDLKTDGDFLLCLGDTFRSPCLFKITKRLLGAEIWQTDHCKVCGSHVIQDLITWLKKANWGRQSSKEQINKRACKFPSLGTRTKFTCCPSQSYSQTKVLCFHSLLVRGKTAKIFCGMLKNKVVRWTIFALFLSDIYDSPISDPIPVITSSGIASLWLTSLGTSPNLRQT